MQPQRIYTKQPNRPGQFFGFGFFLIVAIAFIDQYSKWLVLETMLRTKGVTPGFCEWFMKRETVQYFLDQREAYKTVTVTPFLNFVMVWNQGISFGLFNGDGASEVAARNMSLLFIAVSLIVSILMLVWLGLARRRLLATALTLVVGGALANVIDRVRFGAVADFIDFHAGGWHWPAFNVADSCIVIGAILLIADTFLCKDKQSFFG
jgi:signal peptidase II